jgi:hypothetical protein
MRFSWGVDGFGRKHICFENCKHVLFSPLGNEYFYDCLDLLEDQYK